MLYVIGVVLLVSLEVQVLATVADHMGWLSTLALLVVNTLVGVRLAKAVGLATLGNMAVKVKTGTPIGQDMVETALLLAAGLLFVLPGLLSDGVALLLLVAPVRRLMARMLWQHQVHLHPQPATETVIDAECRREPDSPRSLPPP